ncbi:DUF4959 domain-containing protein [Chitinophaga agrisoli]|uniref:DUF4959 domain-containing protein n=1 Tax=Chitinophaga agrisoli TaxID=2607653 RepID=A0A5B2VMR8_9BACT|nr:DUF4959 domain-containing protein [Chitinophaga agrisoli]KAA2240295.1 DUF4959 domain-containing protein [Chitinophaga agrisoli]
MNAIYKRYWLLLPAILLLVIQLACKKTDGYNEVISTDKTKPSPVTNIKVTNFSGGAYISYSLPDSKNLLYVQAEYKINDTRSRQSKTSFYSDTIMVSGFAKSQDYEVTLYTVTRADVKSDPVTVKVHPDTPAYLLAKPTVVLTNDFGGVNISVQNKAHADIGVILIAPDKSTRKLEIVNQHYTNQEAISYSLRGYDTIPTQFGVYITDSWDNRSDTVYATIKPLYEVQMDKSKFQPYTLPSDVGTDFQWYLPYLWDNKTGAPGFHTPYGNFLPKWMSFDMGQAARLSRYTIWYRGVEGSAAYLWGAGAPQTWVLWGRADQPVDENMPDTTGLPPVGQPTANGWINMGVFHLPAKPSGLPFPQYTGDDLAYWNGGFNFNFALTVPKVRYLRFECVTNASGTNDFFNIMEISLYGDTR